MIFGWPTLVLLLLLAVPAVTSLATATPAPLAFHSPGHASGRAGPPLELAHPPHGRRAAATSAVINPEMLYTAEPAPMGINDFGVDSLGNGYRYTTTEFLGIASIGALKVDNPSLGSYEYSLTIQQNVCLSFTTGGTQYQFWIQNVVFIDTSADATSFENNIWNLSAGSGAMDSNSVSGNGSVNGGQYYADTASTAGSSTTLTYPQPLEFLVVESTVNSMPSVAFEYKDGVTAGWVTYDNVVFPFGAGATGTTFVVDGNQLAPDGLYDDAELILAGPGGGSSTNATAMNVTLSEAYYNGHNFQSIRNAYNFGSDTAETISGVATAKAAATNNASLGVHLTKGSGTLGLSYGSAYSAVVTVKAPVPSGKLVIGSTPPIAFSTSTFNITIAPGNYTFNAFNSTGAVGSKVAKIAAGGTATVTIPLGTVYPIEFGEVGLSQDQLNVSWNLTFGGLTLYSHTSSIVYFMVNGSYDYAVPAIPGFILNGTSGSVTVAGLGDLITLQFVQVLYPVSLYETGLPLGTSWSIGVHGQEYNSTSVLITLSLPNGTFTYTLGIIAGWTAAPAAHASVRVAAAPFDRTFSFHPFTYPILGVESGLPPGTFWGFKVGTNLTVGTFFALRTSEPNGSYTYRATPPAGWSVTPSAGTFNISSSNVSLNFSFVQFRFPANFTEQGLAAGTTWGLVVGGVHVSSTNSTITVLVANGSVPYTVNPVHGYASPQPAGGTLAVSGGGSATVIQFTALPVPDGFLIGTILPAGASLYVDGALVLYSGTSFNLSLPEGAHAVRVTLNGYLPYYGNFTVTAGGRTVVPGIVLQPIQPIEQGTSPTGTGGGSSAPSGLLLAGVGAVLAGAIVVVGLVLWLRRR
jgi:hypothetical protein